ncbi:hypothetical protein TYRP_011488 [Tyrophagus putrescentiae]|nr:hypothetical protein TYRP_011488 [Tyrophagus putrescentiae]
MCAIFVTASVGSAAVWSYLPSFTNTVDSSAMSVKQWAAQQPTYPAAKDVSLLVPEHDHPGKLARLRLSAADDLADVAHARRLPSIATANPESSLSAGSKSRSPRRRTLIRELYCTGCGLLLATIWPSTTEEEDEDEDSGIRSQLIFASVSTSLPSALASVTLQCSITNSPSLVNWSLGRSRKSTDVAVRQSSLSGRSRPAELGRKGPYQQTAAVRGDALVNLPIAFEPDDGQAVRRCLQWVLLAAIAISTPSKRLLQLAVQHMRGAEADGGIFRSSK